MAVTGAAPDDVRLTSRRGTSLAAHWSPIATDAAVVLAHGFCSDKTSRGRFPRLASALNQVGCSVLALDFGGCGASDDELLTLDGQVDDLRTAAAWVRDQGSRRLALYGHSLGSLVCLLAADLDPVTMVLSGACTGPMHYDWAELYGADRVAVLEATGVLPVDGTGGRATVEVSQSLIDAFAMVDPQHVFGAVRCPVLVIHGDSADDQEELQLLANTRRAAPLLPPGSRLHVVAGADHSFLDHYDELLAVAVPWIAEAFSRTSRG